MVMKEWSVFVTVFSQCCGVAATSENKIALEGQHDAAQIIIPDQYCAAKVLFPNLFSDVAEEVMSKPIDNPQQPISLGAGTDFYNEKTQIDIKDGSNIALREEVKSLKSLLQKQASSDYDTRQIKEDVLVMKQKVEKLENMVLKEEQTNIRQEDDTTPTYASKVKVEVTQETQSTVSKSSNKKKKKKKAVVQTIFDDPRITHEAGQVVGVPKLSDTSITEASAKECDKSKPDVVVKESAEGEVSQKDDVPKTSSSAKKKKKKKKQKKSANTSDSKDDDGLDEFLEAEMEKTSQEKEFLDKKRMLEQPWDSAEEVYQLKTIKNAKSRCNGMRFNPKTNSIGAEAAATYKESMNNKGIDKVVYFVQ